MNQNKPINQKEFLLGAFYDQYNSDIQILFDNCLWVNEFYAPEKALELLDGICKTDRENVQVLALFNTENALIAFFPYTVQNTRWLLPIKAYICWWCYCL